MKRIGTLLFVSLALLLPGAAPADEEVAASCPQGAAIVNVTIEDDEIGVDPDSVEISIDQTKSRSKVCWQIDGLDDGYTLVFFKKGTTAGTGYFPELDKKVKGKSGKPRQRRIGVPNKKGEWWYGLRLKQGGTKIDELDPVVIILD